jgi:hypothetical protein
MKDRRTKWTTSEARLGLISVLELEFSENLARILDQLESYQASGWHILLQDDQHAASDPTQGSGMCPILRYLTHTSLITCPLSSREQQ